MAVYSRTQVTAVHVLDTSHTGGPVTHSLQSHTAPETLRSRRGARCERAGRSLRSSVESLCLCTVLCALWCWGPSEPPSSVRVSRCGVCGERDLARHSLTHSVNTCEACDRRATLTHPARVRRHVACAVRAHALRISAPDSRAHGGARAGIYYMFAVYVL